MFATAFFMASNTTVRSFTHSIFFTGSFMFFSSFFWFFSLRSGRSFSVKLAVLGMNFARWFILPRNDPNCFSNFVGLRFCIASVLVIFRLTPDYEWWCPNQLTWFIKNSHFEIFNARFSSSKFFSTVSTNFSCSVLLLFDTMRKSFQKNVLCPVNSSVHSFLKIGWHVYEAIELCKESIRPGSLSTNDIELTLLSCVCSQF